MGLSSKSQQKGHGYEFLARNQQRNHGCEFLAWLGTNKGTMVVSSWQKPIMGATLNQTHKGAMIASLWKESAEKLLA